MATSRRTLRHARTIRVDIDTAVEAAVADLVRAWGVAWDAVADEWRAAVADLTAGMTDGRWPSRAVILRNARVQAAMQVTARKLEELGQFAGVRIVQGVPDLLASQEAKLFDVIRSQLPDSLEVDWARVPDRELDAIVKRTTRQITSRLRPLPRHVAAGLKQELIRGVATGTNPNRVASILIKRFGTRFNGGLWRARTVARTEMLDATRDAALASRQANRALLAGWRWMCALSARTCPSCLAMNGRLFDVDEPGPNDHQCGRCTAVPVTKTWRELGIDAAEPQSQFPDSRAWFAQQTPAVQTQIMGAKRLQALNSGALDWDRIPVRRSNPGWRDSWVPAAA
jgi:SPP1 gp7 family putative phage head morphogenesis protein